MRIRLGFQGFPAAAAGGRGPWAGPLGVLGALVLSAAALGDNRAFTFVYETTTMPKGSVEYEQWATWSTHKAKDSSFDRFDFRHEIEFGVTDRFQLAAYFDWRYQDGTSVGNDRAEWRDVALEAIFNLSDPTTDILGSALYGEVKVGDGFLEFEGKLLLQKTIDRFNLAYNATIEAEWEGADYSEETGKVEQSLGVSYEFSPSLTLGAEAVHSIELPDWSGRDDDVLYLGPNVSYRPGTWWITATPLVQVTDNDGAADFKLRVLMGFDF